MTIPVRQGRRAERRRRFDLRSTAMFFLLLAIIWCVLAFLARTAAVMVERRPVWAGVLAVLGLAGALRFRSGWRRFSAGRYARRGRPGLGGGRRRGSEHLGATATEEPAAPAGTGAPAEPTAETVILEEPAAPLLAADYAELDPDGFEVRHSGAVRPRRLPRRGGGGGAGDLGADVVAIAPDGRRVVIQCKQVRRREQGRLAGRAALRGTLLHCIHEADVSRRSSPRATPHGARPRVRPAVRDLVCLNGDELEAWRQGPGGSPGAG
ncbi:restriction endonuclease [Streptomyces tricolor]|nr:restriction endonuclease [Streptomyces tricolor]